MIMNMDIDRFIPDNSENWIIKHNTIYFKKYGLIPILKQIDGHIFISLDRRITKPVIKITNKLTKMEEPFFFCDRNTIYEKNIHNEDLQNIVRNYIIAISDESFFKFISISEFDYINNFANFLTEYNCHKTFKAIYDFQKDKLFNRKWTDWYTNKTHWEVKNEEIRDYYSILERQIKLSIFFSS